MIWTGLGHAGETGDLDFLSCLAGLLPQFLNVVPVSGQVRVDTTAPSQRH